MKLSTCLNNIKRRSDATSLQKPIMQSTFKNNETTILIVDDTPANLKILFAYLRQLNFRVLVAEDGEDALAKVQYNKPNLILLDIMMPDMDGFETCERLKKDPETCDIPIIFVSALDEVVDKIKGFQLGAVDYINKPFECQEVLARITVHLELNYTQQQLQQKNGELEAFAHTVAHDLKNPLNAIKGFSELLEEESETDFNQEIHDYIHLLQQANQQALTIIDELLLLAGLGNQTVSLEPIDMPDLIQETILHLSYLINQYQAQITVQPNHWRPIKGHAQWIQAIWANYLSNAIKYGGRPPKIEIGMNETPKGIKFWIKDNGAGLTEEQQSQLFIPFSRISQKRRDSHGLGLSIVQRIAEKCQGTVGVESQINEGSVFYFILPY